MENGEITNGRENTPGGRVLAVRIGEAAKMLSISRSKAYDLIRRGELPAIKIGQSLRVPVAELEAWLKVSALRSEAR